MRRSSLVLVWVSIAMATSMAGADTGRFTSYSTTASRSPGQLDFNVNVSTTGLITPNPTTSPDYVIVLGAIMPTTSTFLTIGTTTTIPRTALGAGAFNSSFSITGLNDNTSYKWLTLALGDLYGLGPSYYYGIFIPFYYLLWGCLPIGTTTTTGPLGGLFLTTPATTAPLPIACTGTTTYPGGPLYDFINSNVNTVNATLNWWYSDGTTSFPVWANGVATGLAAPLLNAIPTLASWGLMVLGTLIALTGVILSRRT